MSSGEIIGIGLFVATMSGLVWILTLMIIGVYRNMTEESDFERDMRLYRERRTEGEK